MLVVLAAVTGIAGYFVYRDHSSFPTRNDLRQEVTTRENPFEDLIPEARSDGGETGTASDLDLTGLVPLAGRDRKQGTTKSGPSLKAPPVVSSIERLDAPIPRSRPFIARPVAISTGLVRVRRGSERIAPLQIKTAYGGNYFVKLKSAADGREELVMYIEGGQTFTTEVPLGTYELFYATGDVWYGERHEFGPGTPHFMADKQFTFYRKGNRVNGYTIELILQVGGNLRTRRIDPSRF